MPAFGTVRVAAIQATPVILDAEATVAKAVTLLADAAGRGARLAVLPEAFVSLYPSNAWARSAPGFGGWNDLWERMWESSIDVSGPLVARLVAACREHGLYCAIGINEREDVRPGSLYNTMLVLGPDGVRHRHRKLMPTMQERVFHGFGAGDDLAVCDLEGVGRVGGLICWTTSRSRCPRARRSSARAARRSSSRRGARSSPARCAARRRWSWRTAICARGCMPSAGSTPSGTTAAPRSSPRRPRRRRGAGAGRAGRRPAAGRGRAARRMTDEPSQPPTRTTVRPRALPASTSSSSGSTSSSATSRVI